MGFDHPERINPITGKRDKKNPLNKKKLTKEELDEIMMGEDDED